MLPKTKKKAMDLIALGSRQKDSSSNNSSSSGDAAASALSLAFNSSTSQTVSSINKGVATTNAASAAAAASTTATVISETVHKNGNNKSNTNNTTSNSTNNINNNSNNYLDPKLIKEEINKLIDKEDSTDKLVKLVRSIIINLKFPNQNSNQQQIKQQQQQQSLVQQQQQQQPDLNFLIALSLVVSKRPDLFLKQPTLVDSICTNLLFTSKQQDKSNSASVLKPKSLQMIRNSINQNASISTIQPTVCQLLFNLYEHESSWPEIFIKAYVDDSLGERAWVDNSACKEFVQNTLTAFGTKAIPFSVDNLTTTSTPTPTTTTTSSSNNMNTTNNEPNSQNNSNDTTTNGSENDINNRKFELIPRYASTRNEIEILISDLIRQFAMKQQPTQRILGQSNVQSSSSLANSAENKNFLKLLQNACGFCEVRALAASKLEGWLANPKLTSTAQDLLLAICVNVNCSVNESAEKDIIAQVIKLKPKIKQNQHYFDCIRELIKGNPNNFETIIHLIVLNDLNTQQQYYSNQSNQVQQQQQIPQNRNQHYLNILQAVFSTDGVQASKILAEIMQKQLIQRHNEDILRPLRSLLRDTIKNSRQDFDLIKFTHGLLNSSIPLADFNHIQARERYANGLCDLITVCILVAITPQIKEAYLRRQHDTKEQLIKYYMVMAQIQCDTIIWLYDTVFNIYKVNPNSLINCMFKILFMVDKPEQCYSIDNWPSEQERGIMFKVVSEIPVLFETLQQVLIITKSLPDNMFMLMLCVEENLLKQAALVHNRDIYTLNIKRIDSFVELLFSICLYTYQNPPTVSLAVTVLYWKAWQILLIITALDPKGFGLTAWEKYPILRLLMEMIMTEDYQYPPQSSIVDEYTIEKYRSAEINACLTEKQEILEFENFFELKQESKIVRTEANSNLIDKVTKFDPNEQVRRPTNETIQNIRKLNAEYKLGQMLCKSRQPDFLLALIKRQNSSLSLPWLSSLIESSSSDCLEIMPIQCICEFVWNMLGGIDEIPLKKQINIEQLIQRLKIIITTSSLNDQLKIQQINDTFEYFLNKMCSDKQAVRMSSLKILQKLLINEKQQQIDLNQLIDLIKSLNTFTIYLQPILIKYFRRIIIQETNPFYLNIYICFLFEQSISDYQQKLDLESSLQMQIETVNEPTSILIKNESFKITYNEIACDFANFFFNRHYFFDSIMSLNYNQNGYKQKLLVYFIKFAQIMLSLNEHHIDDSTESSTNESSNIKALLRVNQPFDRKSLETNSYLLIELINSKHYIYIHEKIFNLIIYLVLYVIDATSDATTSQITNELANIYSKNLFYSNFEHVKLLNCSIKTALNDQVKNKILSMNLNSKDIINKIMIQQDQISFIKFPADIIQSLVDSIADFSSSTSPIENNLNELLEYLIKKYGISKLSIYMILNKMDSILKDKLNDINEIMNMLCNLTGYSLNYIIDLVDLNKKKLNESINDSQAGSLFLDQLYKIKEKFSITNKQDEATSTNQMMILGEDNELTIKNYEFLFPLKKKCKKTTKPHLESLPTDIYSNYLDTISKQINEIKSKQSIQFKSIEEPMQIEYNNNDSVKQNIDNIVNTSTKQNLEANLNEHLNKIDSDNERINLIANSILNYEKVDLEIDEKQPDSVESIENLVEKTFSNQSTRCLVDILLDYFCHLDPQIVSGLNPIEYQVLFELRNTKQSKSTTQPFLLSLFIHQGDWKKLNNCVLFLLDAVNINNLSYSMNPTIVLDFLSSLIHIPELWKGTESKVTQKYNEENILVLTESQIFRLIDFILEEMCQTYQNEHELANLKFKLNKRVQLLKHFFKNYDLNHTKRNLNTNNNNNNKFKKQKENLIEKIVKHLEKQKQIFTQNNASKEKYYSKIQNFLLYSIYLEENSIINYIKNPHRIFSNLYYKIDIPTKLDVIAHNLLNCFGEIEVNFSMNATSSGRIGVASTVTNFKKQEKLEIVAYAKKQEEFMMDANLVCIKLASTHPFIFIRQIPMMEGLLQGRVVYTYEEFKKRKFDKLFHYIIDLLNILVPYVFQNEYLIYVEPIISHYFDVFRSYCSENREANGSLVQKFFDFLEKLFNTDVQVGFNLIIKKHSTIIIYLYKLYTDINSLKFINSMLTIPFELIMNKNNDISDSNNNCVTAMTSSSSSSVNIFNQKIINSIWSTKQLEPFIGKILNRENYDGVLSVLQEIDTVSQRQPVVLTHFIFHLQPLMQDINDNLRDLSISLIMRYLRLNPKDSIAFLATYSECLISQNSKVYNSVMKNFPDFIVLCSENSNLLLRNALKGASKHNIDISKTLSDSIRLLNLEKYVY